VEWRIGERDGGGACGIGEGIAAAAVVAPVMVGIWTLCSATWGERGREGGYGGAGKGAAMRRG